MTVTKPEVTSRGSTGRSGGPRKVLRKETKIAENPTADYFTADRN
jgi:hypothetical protein